jgi:hypothetical protein
MAWMIAAGAVWIALFAALQWAMKYDAEHAEAFAFPIESAHTIDDVVKESRERSSDRRVG